MSSENTAQGARLVTANHARQRLIQIINSVEAEQMPAIELAAEILEVVHAMVTLAGEEDGAWLSN